MTGYSWLWILWIGLFGAIEGWALWRNRDNRDKSRTLTAHVIGWFNLGSEGWNPRRNPLRWVFAAFAVWLGWHFLVQP